MTQRQFFQGLFAGGAGTLLGGTALLYMLIRLDVVRLAESRYVRPG